ncbi:MAG: hypothetical protein WB562_08400 [Candidatus Sulfotelmatobacter sp.]
MRNPAVVFARALAFAKGSRAGNSGRNRIAHALSNRRAGSAAAASKCAACRE